MAYENRGATTGEPVMFQPASAPPPVGGNYQYNPAYGNNPQYPQVQQPNVTVVQVQQPVTTVGDQWKKWDTPLCGCFDDMLICCCAIFNPCYICCLYNDYDECFCTPCCVGSFSTTLLYTQHRNRHKIHGSICNDCLVTLCCTPCAVCQLARSMRFHGISQ